MDDYSGWKYEVGGLYVRWTTSWNESLLPNVEYSGDMQRFNGWSLVEESSIGDKFYRVVQMPTEFTISGLKYCLESGTTNNLILVGFEGELSDLVIPDRVEYGGHIYYVKEVGDRVFYNCNSLKSVDFGSVIRIGDYAFSGCTGLSEIAIPSTVKEVGDHAFYKCINLKEIVIGNDVAVLKTSSFSRCDGLERLVLPDSLENVEKNVFYGLTFLSPEGDKLSQTADNLRGATFEGTGKTLYKQVPVYTITWTNDDGFVIDETAVFHGSVPQHDDSVKASDAQYTYAFVGWSPEIVPATGDATYAAVFSKTLNSYTVTWVVDDFVSERIYQYGKVPSYSSVPSKAPSEGVTYEFERWEPSLSAVTGDATYTAVFREVAMLGC